MKKLAFGALGGALCAAIVVACGGGSKDKVIQIMDAPTVASTCDPVAQTGCMTGEKCAWIVDQVGSAGASDLAHIGCTMDGTAALGSACTGGPGVAGADTCVHGTACDDAACVNICAPGSAGECPTDKACQLFDDYFQVGSANPIAGVCKPICDPLTQELGFSVATGSADNKGAACPTMEGCYGQPLKGGVFTCVPAGPGSNTDFTTPGSAGGGPFPNSCAPGNILVFDFTIAGVTTAYCQAYCEPFDTYAGETWTATDTITMGSASIDHKDGVAPYDCVRPAAEGTAAESCLYSWSLGAKNSDNFIPGTDPPTALEPFSDHLGLCWDFDKTTAYDPTDPENGTTKTGKLVGCDQVAWVPDPTFVDANCAMMGPTFCNKPAEFEDSVSLGCVSYETAMTIVAANPAKSVNRKRVVPGPLASMRIANGFATHAELEASK